VKRALILACCSALLAACASHPDRFYILNPQPAAATPRTTPVTQVTLRIKLPAWLDRSQLVIDTSSDGVRVLEHERWAAPLADLVAQTLAMNLERRRSDIVVADLGASHAAAYVSMIVEVTKLTIRRGERVHMEVQWRIVDAHAGTEVIRSDEFSGPLSDQGYEPVAQALSRCLGQLADKIIADLPQTP
jgi:uncharacterized lipoprotein YmbA